MSTISQALILLMHETHCDQSKPLTHSLPPHEPTQAQIRQPTITYHWIKIQTNKKKKKNGAF